MPGAPFQGELSELAAEGADTIAVVPLFLAKSFFSDYVVLKLVGLPGGATTGRVDKQWRTLTLSMAATFGDRPAMSDVMLDAVAGLDPDGTTNLLIGHVSNDGSSLRTVETNADHLRSAGYDVVCCFNEMQDPDVEAGLAEALSRGRTRIYAIPMFVSPRFHTTEEIPRGLGIPEGSGRTELDGVSITYSREIGMEPDISGIVASLAEEALESIRSKG